MHLYCALAKAAVEQYVEHGTILELAVPLPQDLQRPAACFVSIHKQSGELRGCIGTVQPVETALAHELDSQRHRRGKPRSKIYCPFLPTNWEGLSTQ